MISVRLAALAAAGVIGAATLQPVLTAQSPTRVIGIGDIHGSFDGITTILRRTLLIDMRCNGAGSALFLCRPANYTDRGTGRVSLPFFNFEELLGAAVIEFALARDALLEKAEGKDPDFDVALLREAQEVLGVSKLSLMDPEGPLWFCGYARWTEAVP